VDNSYPLANLTAAYRRVLNAPNRRKRLPPGCSREDLLHEAVLDVLESLTRQGCGHRPAAELERWLCRSLHFRRLAAWRKQRDLASIEEVEEGELVSRQVDPLSALCSREMRLGLRSALLALSPSHREVLVLRTLGGADWARTIRHSDGASPRAIRQRLVRARSNLHRALGEQFGR
jgi:DNA-directed RNA polymerase specialized sigma24 family protein